MEKTVEVLKDNEIVTVKMSTFMYYRLHKLLLNYLPFKDAEELGRVIDTIKNQTPHPDPLSYHTETVLLLMNLIEESAKQQSLVRMARVNMETGEEITGD